MHSHTPNTDAKLLSVMVKQLIVLMPQYKEFGYLLQLLSSGAYTAINCEQVRIQDVQDTEYAKTNLQILWNPNGNYKT